jgi:type II secretory pathway predicted ATPase ExeA
MAVPRTQFYHPARLIDAALHGIDRAIRRAEGIALVVGSPGTGKSLLLAKVAESVADDFKVALLSGASICTRRALWQSILADLGHPYRGIDEAELRIAVAELVRKLAGMSSGLVILVDEAHTLPLRLIDELRLLANTPTPLPAVHIVLAGPSSLEERLGAAKMESFAQRIAVRSYLEPLDHAETVAYLRTQTKAAGLDWNACFEPGCDDAVYSAADGVPRLMNQICDQALVLLADARRRVKPSDIAAAWQEIQRLPSTALFDHAHAAERELTSGYDDARDDTRDDIGDDIADDRDVHAADSIAELFSDVASDGFPEGYLVHEPGCDSGVGVVEFGSLDDHAGDGVMRPFADIGEIMRRVDDGQPVARQPGGMQPADMQTGGRQTGDRQTDAWHGPDVEFVFDASTDPFQEFFEQEERVVERYVVRSPDDFSRRQHVASGEGASLVRQLAELEETLSVAPAAAVPDRGHSRGGTFELPSGVAESPAVEGPGGTVTAAEPDDADMVVIEEDVLAQSGGRPAVEAVRLGDYRRLFARLRRGG